MHNSGLQPQIIFSSSKVPCVQDTRQVSQTFQNTDFFFFKATWVIFPEYNCSVQNSSFYCKAVCSRLLAHLAFTMTVLTQHMLKSFLISSIIIFAKTQVMIAVVKAWLRLLCTFMGTPSFTDAQPLGYITDTQNAILN